MIGVTPDVERQPEQESKADPIQYSGHAFTFGLSMASGPKFFLDGSQR
jgi:hypothetical protein